MTTTDEARVTKKDPRVVTDEELRHIVAADRLCLSAGCETDSCRVIVALADRLAARDKERAEMVALLEDQYVGENCATWSYRCEKDTLGGPCWEHQRIALLAKLRTP